MSDGSQILVFDFKLIPIPVSVVEADVLVVGQSALPLVYFGHELPAGPIRTVLM